jgi:hypothetical protein
LQTLLARTKLHDRGAARHVGEGLRHALWRNLGTGHSHRSAAELPNLDFGKWQIDAIFVIQQLAEIGRLNRPEEAQPASQRISITSWPSIVGYSQLSVVPCCVNGFTPRVGRRW